MPKPGNEVMALDALPGEERLREFMKQSLAANQPPAEPDWMSTLQPYLHIVSTSATPPEHPRITFSLIVQPQHCSKLGNMHGGCQATLFDFCTSLPVTLVSRPGFWSYFGVSRTLNVTYLRPVPCGTKVLVECEAVHLGRNLGSLKGTMKRESDGAVLSTCEHGKVNTDPEPSKL